jgi:phosphoribosyl-ATP pyrophosphohydrolase/phosphoribosyl-AMP cyclohydrolase
VKPETLDFDKGAGLVPVIAQHWLTGEVLMLGYATRQALEASIDGGLLTFHSRSRGALWTKGETSGNTLRVVSLHGDCDGDAVLARVDPTGPTCHTGARSCFGADEAAAGTSTAAEAPGGSGHAPTLAGLAYTLESRRGADPGSSYTARLLADRNHRLKKLGEEAAELAVACADGDIERVREEAADVIYHTLVAAMAAGVGVSEILAVLEGRRR